MDASSYLVIFSEIWVVFMVGAISPAADALIVLKNSLSHGRRAGLWTSLGLGASVFSITVVTLWGFGVLLKESVSLQRLVL